MNAPQRITTLDDITSALHCIPSHDRDVWVRMAMAVKSELGEDGFNLWDDWSQGASNYDTSAARATWKSITPHGKVSVASLFNEAISNGWKPSAPSAPITPEERQRIEAEREAATQQAEQLKTEQRAQAKAKAVKDWAESLPTAHSHAYTIAKGITPHGAKTLNGMLLLPLYANGELVNLQRTNGQGEKRFLTGGQVKGAYMPIGKLTKETKEAILCEGWATGCSLYEATGTPVVIAWNAGNLSIIAQRLKEYFPTMALRVCGDNDASNTDQKAAHDAASIHGLGAWCMPTFSNEHLQACNDANKTKPNDFNDLHQLAGLEEVRRQTLNVRLLEFNQEPQNLQETPEPLATHTANQSTEPSFSEDDYINHLASLNVMAYERTREDAAKTLQIRASVLDKLVNGARKELATKEDDAAGISILFDEVEPWPTPVSGEKLLDDVFALLCRYVIADKETLRAATLWVALTWFTEYATVLPLAVITAPEKGCGKSTLLTALAKLACRPLSASNITSAALFRAVEAWRPTLMIDEADSFAKDNEELRGIINSGHTKETAVVIRVVEVNGELQPRAFSTWGAKALAGIGHLPETIMSRAVILNMRRKLKGEACENLRRYDNEAFTMVKRQLARWADDHGERFKQHIPDLEGLHNRTADNWEPLLSLADLAQGEWPKIARQAAHKLTDTTNEAPSFNEELLGDIRAVFEKLGKDRISSAGLLESLCKDDEAAWLTYNRGRPLTAKQLCKKLADFSIQSKTTRFGDHTLKGYLLSDFDDVFTRYLS